MPASRHSAQVVREVLEDLLAFVSQQDEASKSPSQHLPPTVPKGELHTFDEWKTKGRCVMKGQRATAWRDGKAMFAESQTDCMLMASPSSPSSQSKPSKSEPLSDPPEAEPLDEVPF